jgi:hypothetical protein
MHRHIRLILLSFSKAATRRVPLILLGLFTISQSVAQKKDLEIEKAPVAVIPAELIHSYVLPSGLQLEIFRRAKHPTAGCAKWLPITESSEVINYKKTKNIKSKTPNISSPENTEDAINDPRNLERLIAIFAARKPGCELVPTDITGVAGLNVSSTQSLPNLMGFRIRVSPPQTIVKFVGKDFADELRFTVLQAQNNEDQGDVFKEGLRPKISGQSVFRFLPGLGVFISPALASAKATSSTTNITQPDQILSTFGGGTTFDFFFYKPLQFQFEIFQSVHRFQLIGNPDLPSLYNYFLFGLRHELIFSKSFVVPTLSLGLNLNRLDAGFAAGTGRAMHKVNSISGEVAIFFRRFAPHYSRNTFLKNSAFLSETRYPIIANDGIRKISNLELKNTYYYRVTRDTLIGLGHWKRSIGNSKFQYSLNGFQLSIRLDNLFLETL